MVRLVCVGVPQHFVFQGLDTMSQGKGLFLWYWQFILYVLRTNMQGKITNAMEQLNFDELECW